MMWDIWAEGFHIQGGDPVGATFVGAARGDSFEEAVVSWYLKNPSSTFDRRSLSDWGCRLYPTQAEARKSFG